MTTDDLKKGIKQSLFDLEDQKIIGVISVNSIDFVQTIFHCFQQNQIAVFLNSEEEFYKIEQTGIQEIIRPKLKFGWCETKFIPQDKDSIAQIAFTSGTTGNPKGVILTHQNLNDVVQRLNQIMEVDSSIREYVGVPVNYSFGFGRCRAVATVGGKFYVPENGFYPLEIKEMLLQGTINAISAVPSLWRLLFQCQDIFGEETNKVRWIEIGSQYMSQKEKELLRHLFPQAKIIQHYGLTEASRSTFLEINSTASKHLESVGKVYGKTKIKISPEQKIMIKGPHVAQKILVNGKLIDNVDNDGWLTTSDLGKLEDEYIYYQGRADDLINCGGIKISPETIEKLIREKLKIQAGITVARIKDSLRGDGILVAVLKDANLSLEKIKKSAQEAIATHNIKSFDAIKLIELEEFPRTATGKIKRKELAQIFESHSNHNTSIDSNTLDVDKNISECEKQIMTIWQSVLGVRNINVESNFFEIGGDSLSAISVMMKIEQLGLSQQIVKGMLQGLSVRELAQRIENSETENNLKISHCISDIFTKNAMNINIIRGLLVLCVIFGHWSEGIFERLPSGIGILFKPLMASIFSAGTPGFAIIYGVSVGYSLFNIFQKDKKHFQKIISSTLKLLISGVIIIALTSIINQLVTSDLKSFTFTTFTNSFYGIITYYLLITATLTFWLRVLNQSQQPAAIAIFLSACLYSLYYILIPLSSLHTSGFLELVKLLITAKYSYIDLTAGVMMGIAVGITLRETITKSYLSMSYIWIGISLIVSALDISAHSHAFDSWFIWPQNDTTIWMWFFYLGWILLILKLNDKVLSWYNQFIPQIKFVFQALATIGILAFPFYISHGLVIPLEEILVALGLSHAISIILSIFLFMAYSIHIFKKIYEANFIW